MPNFTWIVGIPLRSSSPSMRSSWIRVKLWMYSTATARGTALDLSPPTAPQQATAMAGLILLPPRYGYCLDASMRFEGSSSPM